MKSSANVVWNEQPTNDVETAAAMACCTPCLPSPSGRRLLDTWPAGLLADAKMVVVCRWITFNRHITHCHLGVPQNCLEHEIAMNSWNTSGGERSRLLVSGRALPETLECLFGHRTIIHQHSRKVIAHLAARVQSSQRRPGVACTKEMPLTKFKKPVVQKIQPFAVHFARSIHLSGRWIRVLAGQSGFMNSLLLPRNIEIEDVHIGLDGHLQ